MTEATTTPAAEPAGAAADTSGGAETECWCCGRQYAEEGLVRLGNHPEVSVCLACAHYLHQQARQREDRLRPSIAARGRDALRWGRRMVMDRRLHQRPLIGRPLRWLGRRLP